MRKLIAIALFSILGMGLTQGKASAWWEHLCCKHKCCLTLTCRQYNAFSPFCCDGACGFMPLAQGPSCGNGGCTYSGDGGCMGELPAPAGAPAPAAKAPQHTFAPMPNGPTDTAQNFPQAAPMQAYPNQGYPVQGYPQGYPVQGYQGQGYQGQGYPAYGYGAGYPTGVPSYNPNFAGYGAYNGPRR